MFQSSRKCGLCVAAMVIWYVCGVAAGASTTTPVRVLPRTVPADQNIAQILSEVVVCRQPHRYIGWPTITRAANGDLLIVFSGDRDWHVDPWGKTCLVRSRDGGKTWTKPRIITNTPLDDRETGIVTLPDGTLVLSMRTSLAFDNPKKARYKPYRKHAAKLSPAVRKRWLGDWLRISHDNGKTWGPFMRGPSIAPHGPTVLRDGRLLYVRPTVYQSTDQGRTWTTIGKIDRPANWHSAYSYLSEQHAAQAANGDIVALSRYVDGKDAHLRETVSKDGGRTWSPPRATKMLGYPAHVLLLNNGWLLATYGRRIPPMGEQACISKDNGKTWLVKDEIVLSNAAPRSDKKLGYPSAWDLGYPCSAQLPDGTIWSVYYQVPPAVKGPYPCLMGTHWRLKGVGPAGEDQSESQH